MKFSARRVRLAVLALAAAAAFAGTAHSARAAAPSVRLLASSDQVTLYRYRRRVLLNLGVWVAPVGGDLQIRVQRPDYDSPLAADQIDATTGDVVRSIPDEALGWRGLRRFFHVTFTNGIGELVGQKDVRFCPNGSFRQRVDDSGPDTSPYPYVCSGSPFMKGMVWGISDGWATSAFGGDEYDYRRPTIRLPAGHYTATVEVSPGYADLFDVAPGDAEVTLDVDVWDVSGGGVKPALQPADSPDLALAAAPLVPDTTSPDPSTLPDLVALPAWSIRMRHWSGRDYLTFAATEWNAGPRRLNVEGFRRPGTDVMDAYQYFEDETGTVVARASAGTFEWDPRPRHYHWHFEQFAAYSLLDADSNEVVRSHKQGFCIFPTDPLDLAAEGAEWIPWNFGRFSVCGSRDSIWVRETLAAGWGDTYYQSVPGQSFNVTRLPTGWYWVSVRVNPQGLLYETSTANNEERRLVYIHGRRGHKRVIVAPWHGITQ